MVCETGCSTFPGSGCHGDREGHCTARMIVRKPFVEVCMRKGGRLSTTKLELVVVRSRVHTFTSVTKKIQVWLIHCRMTEQSRRPSCGSASTHTFQLTHALCSTTFPPLSLSIHTLHLQYSFNTHLTYWPSHPPPPFYSFFFFLFANSMSLTGVFLSLALSPHLFTFHRCPPRRSWLAMWWRRNPLAAGTRWRWWASVWWAWPLPSAYCSRWDQIEEIKRCEWCFCVFVWLKSVEMSKEEVGRMS